MVQINLSFTKKDAKDLSRVLQDQMLQEPEDIKKILSRVVKQTEKEIYQL